jgi:methionyl-tRNA synthetase
MAGKFYITTSIAYANAFPHIGFALESVQADALARSQRMAGKDVFFLTGTDEHGQKIETEARRQGVKPEIFVDKISQKFQDLKAALNLSTDDFIRTTDQKKHWPSVKKAWLSLSENGDIFKKKYKGLYCSGCEAFITEKDLVGGKCPIHKKAPQLVQEENYFFRLSKYSKNLEEMLSNDVIKIIPYSRKNEMIQFVKSGLEDISFSRMRKDLEWGIPVPGDETQTIYVWADALINYISALGYGEDSERFKKYWPADVHCVGKDIQKFHCVIWPAMLLSLGLAQPKSVFIHGFITSAGQKMSKSLGNTVDPFDLVKKYGTDPVRYFLLREIPSTEDGDFTYEKMEARCNGELANGMGNTLSRVLTLIEKKCEGKIPDPRKRENKLKDFLTTQVLLNSPRTGDFDFNSALSKIIEAFKMIDREIDQARPWEWDDKTPEAGDCFYSWAASIRFLALLLFPFIPFSAKEILKQLGCDDKKDISFKEISWDGLEPGQKIKKGENLFPRF